jgi:NAD(P)-dependent dehydrogenase (short-subunit alcohol dehydrogenase family)
MTGENGRVDFGLSDRVVLVTGGTRGLGYAMCESLLAEGARVALCSRDAAGCRDAASSLGPRATGFCADVSEPGRAARLVDEIVDRLGRLDAVVNNAGRFGGGRAVEATDESYREGFDTKVLGALGLVRAALPHLRGSNQARVVNVSGISANRVLNGAVVTAVANAAMLSLTAYLANELIADGVNVCGVLPGYVLTPPWRERTQAVADAEDVDFETAKQIVLDRQGLGHARWGEAREVADVVTFLLSKQASFMNGTVFRIDGGQFPTVRY